MSSPALIYRTNSQPALDWWADAEARTQEVHKKRSAYEEKLLASFGPVGKRYSYEAEEVVTRPLMCNRHNAATGVLCQEGEQPPQGSGWRLDADTGFWKSDMRSKAGKERAAELENLKGVDLRDELNQIGCASWAFADWRVFEPGARFRKSTKELFITWGSVGCAEEMARSAIPAVVWTPVPLSEWHAWREQVEAEGEE